MLFPTFGGSLQAGTCPGFLSKDDGLSVIAAALESRTHATRQR